MSALRTHYTDEAEFVRRVDEVQRPQGYRIVGAFEDDRCVAVAGFRVIRNLAWHDTLYVDDLSTLPEARGRGHGRALLLALFAAFKGDGLRRAELSVHGDNRGAARLYESVGMTASWEAQRWEKALGNK